MLLAIFGIAFEIFGFVLMIKSTRKLVLKKGDFVAEIYVEKSTGKPPQHIEGSPNPTYYRPGIYLVIAGLILQIAAIIVTQRFNYQF
jgi:hypothetical protein